MIYLDYRTCKTGLESSSPVAGLYWMKNSRQEWLKKKKKAIKGMNAF